MDTVAHFHTESDPMWGNWWKDGGEGKGGSQACMEGGKEKEYESIRVRVPDRYRSVNSRD